SVSRRCPPCASSCADSRRGRAADRDPLSRADIGPLAPAPAGIIDRASRDSSDMATSPPTSLFVRLDSRLRQGLQQQIYASIRRAILDRIVAPGARLPSSRALAVDLGASRTTTLLAVQQLQAEGYLTARRGSGTSVAAELPDDLLQRRGVPLPSQAGHPRLSRARSGAAARRAPFAWARPRWICSP